MKKAALASKTDAIEFRNTFKTLLLTELLTLVYGQLKIDTAIGSFGHRNGSDVVGKNA